MLHVLSMIFAFVVYPMKYLLSYQIRYVFTSYSDTTCIRIQHYSRPTVPPHPQPQWPRSSCAKQGGGIKKASCMVRKGFVDLCRHPQGPTTASLSHIHPTTRSSFQSIEESDHNTRLRSEETQPRDGLSLRKKP